MRNGTFDHSRPRGIDTKSTIWRQRENVLGAGRAIAIEERHLEWNNSRTHETVELIEQLDRIHDALVLPPY